MPLTYFLTQSKTKVIIKIYSLKSGILGRLIGGGEEDGGGWLGLAFCSKLERTEVKGSLGWVGVVGLVDVWLVEGVGGAGVVGWVGWDVGGVGVGVGGWEIGGGWVWGSGVGGWGDWGRVRSAEAWATDSSFLKPKTW